MNMTTVERIRAELTSFTPVALDIHDDSHLHAGHAGSASGGGHFRLHIVSQKFVGLGTLARHRMIYAALGPLMKQEIHALSIDAHTPDELGQNSDPA